jgi:hypothetical protein
MHRSSVKDNENVVTYLVQFSNIIFRQNLRSVFSDLPHFWFEVFIKRYIGFFFSFFFRFIVKYFCPSIVDPQSLLKRLGIIILALNFVSLINHGLLIILMNKMKISRKTVVLWEIKERWQTKETEGMKKMYLLNDVQLIDIQFLLTDDFIACFKDGWGPNDVSYTSANVIIRAWILSSHDIVQNDKYIYQKDVSIFQNQVPITSIFNPDNDIVVIQVCLIYAPQTLKLKHYIYLYISLLIRYMQEIVQHTIILFNLRMSTDKHVDVTGFVLSPLQTAFSKFYGHYSNLFCQNILSFGQILSAVFHTIHSAVFDALFFSTIRTVHLFRT